VRPDNKLRETDALRLPFDQYQRYNGAAQLIAALGLSRGRTLEMGASPGFSEIFFADANLFFTDRYGVHEGRFTVADGAALPYRDDSFDVVVALDTLEHIAPQHREAFLRETKRVSRDLVVLSAPHDTQDVALAEAALQAFVTARFGEIFETLQEHADNGLPDPAETAAVLGADGWNVASFGSGYLPRWLLGMVFHHELLATGLPELPELHTFYNQTVAPYDNREPAYRRVFVASQRRTEEELATAVATCASNQEPAQVTSALAAIGGAILARRLTPNAAEATAAREEAEKSRQELADLRRVIADREAHMMQLRERNHALAAQVTDLSQKLADATLGGLIRRVSRRKLG
jgi:Methyltransferase domain